MEKPIAPRTSVFSKYTIMRYADSGIPVTTENAEGMVRYLAASFASPLLELLQHRVTMDNVSVISDSNLPSPITLYQTSSFSEFFRIGPMAFSVLRAIICLNRDYEVD